MNATTLKTVETNTAPGYDGFVILVETNRYRDGVYSSLVRKPFQQLGGQKMIMTGFAPLPFEARILLIKTTGKRFAEKTIKAQHERAVAAAPGYSEFKDWGGC
jgi:hypothetical protein